MIYKIKSFLKILIISLLIILISCATVNKNVGINYPLQNVIPILKPTDEQKREFNSDVKSEFVSVDKNDKTISGYMTKNKLFLEQIIIPIITPHLNEITQKDPVEIINVLTLFGYEIFQKYFGQDFYRWGGDILDLDDPQNESVRYENSFGLDCSGLAAMPYELAVHFKLIPLEKALFSSQGYKKYCIENGKQDIGGREGTSNNYRLDTPELAELGTMIFSLKKDQSPTEEQIALLQAGDIVGKSGHFGIIAEVRGEKYYFESGGWVVPDNNGIPVKAIDALKIFASTGPISVRRCLN